MPSHRTLLIGFSSLLLLAACSSPEPEVDIWADSSASSSIIASSSTSSAGIDPYLVDLSMENLAAMPRTGTGFRLGAVQARNAEYIRYTISYLSNGVKVSGIMNIPNGDGPFPLLVLNHGYIDPAIYTNGRGLKREQDALARRGFAVVHIDYRGHGESDSDPDPRVQARPFGYALDAANVVEAIRNAHIPGVDTEHVGMMGHSMGGGVSLLVITAFPDIADAVVLYAPVSADAWKNFERWAVKREGGRTALEILGSREENPAIWDSISPRVFFDRVRVPVTIFHGTADKDVPYDWSTELEAWLKGEEKGVTLVTYEGEGHEFGPKWNTFIDSAADFFEEQLKKPL